eukprot:scaffold598_cov318-Pavlova_lutheri.AAC.29
MRLRVRLPEEKDVEVEVGGDTSVARLKGELWEREGCAPERHRLIYQGKILRDGDTMEELRVCDGHTMHLVGMANPNRTGSGRRDTSGEETSPRGTRQGWRHPLNLWQLQQRGGIENHRELEEIIIELERFSTEEEEEEQEEARTSVREGENTDLLLGLVVGVMLGFIAGLCLIERGLSQRMKLGILLGLTLNLSFAMLRLSASKGKV